MGDSFQLLDIFSVFCTSWATPQPILFLEVPVHFGLVPCCCLGYFLSVEPILFCYWFRFREFSSSARNTIWELRQKWGVFESLSSFVSAYDITRRSRPGPPEQKGASAVKRIRHERNINDVPFHPILLMSRRCCARSRNAEYNKDRGHRAKKNRSQLRILIAANNGRKSKRTGEGGLPKFRNGHLCQQIAANSHCLCFLWTVPGRDSRENVQISKRHVLPVLVIKTVSDFHISNAQKGDNDVNSHTQISLVIGASNVVESASNLERYFLK